jgi:hypothetical protein
MSKKVYVYYNAWIDMFWFSPYRRKRKGYFYMYGIQEKEFKCEYIGDL